MSEVPGHYQSLATAIAGGLGTGLINDDAVFVTVTASANTLFCTLPAGYVGQEIRGYVGANGFKLRTLASSSTKINNVDVSGGSAGCLIPATSQWIAQKVDATNWLVQSMTNLGASGATIVPA